MEDQQIGRLLERFGSHEAQSAWAEFLGEYGRVILQVVRLFEQEPDHSGDCFLFVCEQLSQNQFRRLRRFTQEGPARFATWLRVVVRNLCLDWRRHEFGRHRVFDAVARLPALDRDVYSRFYEQGLSEDDTLFSLRAKYPQLTLGSVGEAVERIERVLTPRQLWLLSTRRPKLEPLEVGLAEDRQSLGRQIPDSRPDPEALAATVEEQAALERALERLPKPDRLLIRLRFEQSLTLREIAGLVNLKDAQTADRRIREVLERLRRELFGKTDSTSV